VLCYRLSVVIVLCYRLSVVIMLCCYLCSVIIVLFYVLIGCTLTLPPGVNPIAVDKYIYLSKTFFTFRTTFVYCTSRQDTCDKTTLAHCMLYVYDYKHTPTICNTYFHCNSGCTNAPHCYVVRTLNVLLQNLCANTAVYRVFSLRPDQLI